MIMRGHYSETFGQYLKRERESRSVSMEELSKGTRISLPFLEALEKDDFHFFPQREFISGFLKGYARYLGLNPEEVLRRYQIQSELEGRKETFRQLSLFPTIPSAAEEIQEPEKEPQKIPLPKVEKRYHRSIFIQLGIVLIALSLSLYIHYLLKEMESRPPSLKNEHIFNQQDEGKSLETPKKVKIIGNRKSKFYYLPGMKGYGDTDPNQRVEFDTEQEAIKSGFRQAPQAK
jgi:cytoskeletal protein RodZ